MSAKRALIVSLAWSIGCYDATAPRPLQCSVTLAGRCWTYLGPAGEWITSVALTPAGLLVGTKSDGVLRYDSSARGWVSLGLAKRLITSIEVLPPPSNRILVTAIPLPPDTISAVLYASDDGARTWYPLDGGISAQSAGFGYGYSLAYDSSDISRLFLGLPAAVMRSLDGGKTWTTVAGNPMAPGIAVSCLAVAPGGLRRVWAAGQSIGEVPLLLRSDDDGSTWTQLAASPYNGDAVMSLALDPLDANRLYVGMFSGLRRTDDAGSTWQLLLSPRLPGPVTGLAYAEGKLFAISDELVPNIVPTTTTLGLYATADGGVTWDTLPVPPSASGGIAIAMGAAHVGVVGTRTGLWSVTLP